MQRNSRWRVVAERGCLVLFFAWLLWLPLPFGSNVAWARMPLIAVPMALCAMAALVRLEALRERTSTPEATPPWRIWSIGALLLLGVGLVQLVPLPPSLLQAISPESHAMWSEAARLASIAGVATPEARPISIDPAATALELFRLAALFATFQTAALLVRGHSRRLALTAVLCSAAAFQVLYGVREAALRRYAIWGWVNRLIFDRVTGTFVNPNHFAHYLALVLPLALFVAAMAWRESSRPGATLKRRIVQLFEGRIVLFGVAALAALGCLSGVLLAQSRGALLAIVASLLVVAAILPGRRLPKLAFAGGAAAVAIVALIFFLGTERTTAARYVNDSTLAGRRIGITAAAGVWQRFSVFGSGLGTFGALVPSEQHESLGLSYHRAHNDYAEIAATGGTAGFAIGLVALFAGYVALVRLTTGARSAGLSWRRRAFQAAALASLTAAMIHALFDFNFFIPANPATLAAIVGAAVTTIDRDKRTRR